MKLSALILTFLSVILFALPSALRAQSAVAFCYSTNIYGFTYGSVSADTAKADALSRCKLYGGVKPLIVTSSSKGGYGAIAMGRTGVSNKVFVGVSLSQPTREKAEADAMKYVKDQGAAEIRLFNSFLDDGKNSVEFDLKEPAQK